MTITIKEVAGRAGVPTARVSTRTLNNDPKVNPETRDLISSFASQLNYKPNITDEKSTGVVAGKSCKFHD